VAGASSSVTGRNVSRFVSKIGVMGKANSGSKDLL
jgi:hypothetical protein